MYVALMYDFAGNRTDQERVSRGIGLANEHHNQKRNSGIAYSHF